MRGCGSRGHDSSQCQAGAGGGTGAGARHVHAKHMIVLCNKDMDVEGAVSLPRRQIRSSLDLDQEEMQ